MPEHVRFHTDNASSEGKHLTVFSFAAWQVWCDAFQSADCTQSVVGHTHTSQDQRVGVACNGLARITRLEGPLDVVKCLNQAVVPTKNRIKHVEYLTAVYDFKTWLENALQVGLSGHGSSAATS